MRDGLVIGEVIQIPHLSSGSCPPEQDFAFALMVDEALGSIAGILKAIKDGNGGHASLPVLSSRLLDLLSDVEREPWIENAIDQIFEAARRLTCARQCEQEPEQYNDISSAYLRLRRHMVLAKPRSGVLRST
jgi:hypothetical protein